MKLKKIVILALTIFSFIFPSLVQAASLEDLQQIKNEYGNKLAEINQQIQSLKKEQFKIGKQIDKNTADIVTIQIQIQQTQDTIEELQKEIIQKQKELNETNKKKDKQYDMMKKRIKYIYQKGGETDLIILLLNEEDFLSFLNRIEYTKSIHQYDRNMLMQYISTIEKIEKIEKDLEEKKRISEQQKKGLEENKKELEKKVQELKKSQELTGLNIQEALEDAAALANEILRIDYQIAAIEAERQRIIEEQALLNVGAEQQYYSMPAASSEDSEENQVYEYYQPYGESNQLEEEQQDNTITYTTYDQDGQDQIVSYSSLDIVEYANQFVGNSYVYGGDSLTGGIDCSHFVYEVLSDTGNYNGEYTTSNNWAYLGQSVSSLDQAVAGDVIVYSGHVAIYDGEGGIIEAQSPSAGITNDRSADSSTIVAIRRFE